MIRVLLVALAAVACSMNATSSPSALGAVRYVALGDSYTIGTSVDLEDRFPNQLVGRLSGKVDLDLVANLGVNGYSTHDLIEEELPALPALNAQFVTVLIGVNDVVRGTPADAYEANVNDILTDLLDRLPANRIVVVSVPDYTLTRLGGAFGDPLTQRAEIANFNSIMQRDAQSKGIAFVDISPVANKVGSETGLLADDGLHPSGKQYGQWVDLIAPAVETLFGQ